MRFIKLRKTEDKDLAGIAFNNIYEPTFNDSYSPDSIAPMWEVVDLFELDEDLTTTLRINNGRQAWKKMVQRWCEGFNPQ